MSRSLDLERCGVVAEGLRKYAAVRRQIGRNDQYNRLLDEAAGLLDYEETPDEQIRMGWRRVTMDVEGQTLVLNRQEAVFLSQLRARSYVTHDTMISALWGERGSGDALRPYNHLAVIAHRLRQKIKDTGLEIVNHWGAGYELRIKSDG